MNRRLGGTAVAGRGAGVTSGHVTFDRTTPPEHQARPVTLPKPTGRSTEDIKKAFASVMATLLVDDSGSMYGRWGDSTGIRYAAAASLARFMDQAGGGKVAVVHWGTDAPASMVLPPTDVRKGRRAIREALRIPPTLGGNNLPVALTRCGEVLGATPPGAVPVVYVLTDGCEDLQADLTSPLHRLPAGSVHVLLVDVSHACGPDLEAQWQRLPLGSFRRLDHLDTAQLAWQLAHVLTDTVGLELPALPTATNKKEHRA